MRVVEEEEEGKEAMGALGPSFFLSFFLSWMQRRNMLPYHTIPYTTRHLASSEKGRKDGRNSPERMDGLLAG